MKDKTEIKLASIILAWLRKFWYIAIFVFISICIGVGAALSSCHIKTTKFEIEKGGIDFPFINEK